MSLDEMKRFLSLVRYSSIELGMGEKNANLIHKIIEYNLFI
jgi:hypothetical protein